MIALWIAVAAVSAWPVAKSHPRVAISAARLQWLREMIAAGDPTAVAWRDSCVSAAKWVLSLSREQMPAGYTLQENYAPCPADGRELKPVDYSHPELECPKCKKRYSGGEYDAVWRHYFHNNLHNKLLYTAWAYALTGNEKYARAVRWVLLWYADNYVRFKGGAEKKKGRRGFFLDNPLRESYFVYNIPAAYDLVYDYPGLSAEERRHIERDLLAQCAATLIAAPNKLSNFQSWENAGIAAVGYCLADQRLIDYAINDAGNGFRRQMRDGVVDGLWHEGSLAYHFFTLTALIKLAEAARINGTDIYRDPGLKAMFYGPLTVAWPDGKVPRVGDDRSNGIDLARGHAFYWEIAFARYGDPIFAWLLHRTYGDGPRRDYVWLRADCPEKLPAASSPPPAPSSLLPTAGLCFLRSPKLAAMVKFGPAPAWHDHYDKLELCLWALGRELAIDPGMCAQYAFPERSWYRCPISHNCVVVDEQRYSDCRGTATAFAGTGALQLFQGVLPEAYEGVNIRRTVAVLAPSDTSGGAQPSPLVLDLCEVSGGSIHDWVFHVIGRFSTPLALSPADPPPGKEWKTLPAVVRTTRRYHSDLTNGYEYLKNVRSAVTSSSWEASWESQAGILRLVQVGDGKPTQVYAAEGLGYWGGPDVPLVIARRRASRSIYCTAFEPIPAGQHGQIDAVRLGRSASSLLASVRTSSGTLWLSVRSSLAASQPKLSAPFSTDAAVAAVWVPSERAAAAWLTVCGGSKVTIDGRQVETKPCPAIGGAAFIRRAGRWQRVSPKTATP